MELAADTAARLVEAAAAAMTRPPETGPLLMRVLWPAKVGGGGHHGETTQAHA